MFCAAHTPPVRPVVVAEGDRFPARGPAAVRRVAAFRTRYRLWCSSWRRIQVWERIALVAPLRRSVEDRVVAH